MTDAGAAASIRAMRTAILVFAFVLSACGASQRPAECRCDAEPPSNRAPVAGATAEPAAAPAEDRGELRAELEATRAEVAALRAALAQKEAPRPTPPRRPAPDPDAVYAVDVADAPWRGERHAPVTVVKAFEFACPFCERTRSTMDQLLADYKGDIKIVYRNFIVHQQTAVAPALAACAAAQQGKFERYAELVWTEGFQKRDFAEATMERLARQAGLKMPRFRKDRDGLCKARLDADQKELARVGVRGTPAFFINGRYLSGARPYDQFKTLVDEELARAGQRIRDDKGTSRRNYYQKHVLEAGERTLE